MGKKISKVPPELTLKSLDPGEIEHCLPSGDMLDVFFRNGKEHIGVEVKSAASANADLTRGIFQCVKYQAVLEARLASEGRPKNVRTILVLEGALPDELMALKNMLGVDVFEGVTVKK